MVRAPVSIIQCRVLYGALLVTLWICYGTL